MGKLVKIVAAIAILIAVPKIIQKAMGLDEASQTRKHMAAIVSEMKTKLPIEVGPGVTFTAVEFEKTTLRNTYVVDESANFDSSRKSDYEKTAVRQVCDGAFKELSKRGITVEFRYKFRELGVDRTLDITLPPSKCT